MSKSAVHRFGKEVYEELKADVELRMRCIELASKLTVSDQVIEKAEELLLWAKSGATGELDMVP